MKVKVFFGIEGRLCLFKDKDLCNLYRPDYIAWPLLEEIMIVVVLNSQTFSLKALKFLVEALSIGTRDAVIIVFDRLLVAPYFGTEYFVLRNES